jgi:tellurite resistance protein TehA-like permease
VVRGSFDARHPRRSIRTSRRTSCNGQTVGVGHGMVQFASPSLATCLVMLRMSPASSQRRKPCNAARLIFRHGWQLSHFSISSCSCAVQPAWMIPPVGISLASSTGAEMGLTLGGHISIFFWIGLSFFAVFYPACLYRALAYPIPPPERQEPLFAIFAAPAALLLSTWITLGGHQGHTLTHFLFLIEMLSIVLVATKIPRLSSLQFSPEHSAFTFPADIAAKACIIYTHLYMAKSGAMVVCSWLFLSLATVAVTVTLLRFCRAALHAIANPDSLADESSA